MTFPIEQGPCFGDKLGIAVCLHHVSSQGYRNVSTRCFAIAVVFASPNSIYIVGNYSSNYRTYICRPAKKETALDYSAVRSTARDGLDRDLDHLDPKQTDLRFLYWICIL